ncbi:(2Fe-2S)-binding protein [Spirillospora albida]|uniref:(2Fe-2S)-binding protein n=1 Tax=Spirillospora albida TaxID=58123 RepID=UPI0004C22B15|nr:(2Fe-2S)-binding protein [Spirillospora albida]
MNATRISAGIVGRAAEEALEPLFERLRAIAATGMPLGAVPGLRPPGDGWAAVGELTVPPHDRLGELVGAVERQWDAPAHVAAALWWKSFSYWSTLPAVLGWALNRRVPVPAPDTTMVRTIAEEPRMQVAATEFRVVTGDTGELGEVIAGTLLRDLHAPLIEALHALTRAGRRGLWGSVAEALADPLIWFADDLVDDPAAAARALLDAVGEPVAGLVELPGPRRRTCCLWVTLPGREPCSTCCVTGEGNARAGS